MGANAQTSVPAFTSGQVLTAAQVNNINTGIPVFASSTERDAAFGGTGEKTLAEGQMAYLEDTDATQYYDGSSWAAIAGGKILQVIQTVKTDFFTTTSNSFVDVTGLSVSITPSSASNKVLVTAVGLTKIDSGADITYMNLVRDSTNIGQSTAGTTQNTTQFNYPATAVPTNAFNINFLDSPATTSATTYKLQIASTGSGNQSTIGGVSTNYGAITTITVMEVSA